MRSNDRILLLGKHGQLGWELQRTLAALGPVTAIDYEDVDFTDGNGLREAVRELTPRVIVNAAAYTDVDKAETERERAYAINAAAPGVLAEEAKKLGAGLIHYSTDYVFDGTASEPYTETSATNPLGVYGATKLAGEQAVAASGADYLTLRTAWLYSNHGKNFLNTMLRLAGERNALRVVDDQTGSPTYSDLVASATLEMLEGLYSNGSVRRERCGLYHVTCEGQTTWCGFTKKIVELSGHGERVHVTPITTAEYPTPAKRPAYSVLSNARLAQVFGIRLPDWQAGLRKCLAERSVRG